MELSKTMLNNRLFEGISGKELSALLECLGGRFKRYKKDSFIFIAGESIPKMGMLLSGGAQVIRENILGDRMIIGDLGPGDLFGETFACAGLAEMPVSVVTTEETEILFLEVNRLVYPCSTACSFHQRLTTNFLRIMAQKNIFLNKKMSYITHKTIRERLKAYFLDLMEEGGGFSFTLPFSRSQLADYLCMDRSAMTRELSRMRQEGLLTFEGRRFRWLSK